MRALTFSGVVTKLRRCCQGSNGATTIFFDRAKVTAFDSTWSNLCAETSCRVVVRKFKYLNEKLWFLLTMIDENMLLREGLFDRTFAVLAEIRHPNNSTKLTDINSIRPASSKRLTERKEAVTA